MNDKQIEHIKKLKKEGNKIAWFDGENYREITRISKVIPTENEDYEEIAAFLSNGKYVDLYNVNELEMVTIHISPIFPHPAKIS